MFEQLLQEIYEKAGELNLKTTQAEYKELIDEFLPWLSIECEPLIGASQAILGEQIFKDFEIGLEYYSLPSKEDGLMPIPIDIGHLYVRRKREDQNISINCSIYRCNISHYLPASIKIELDICGYNGRKAFEELYKNYRRPIQKCLEQEKIEFFTSYCSDIVGKYKGNSPSKKLDEYFSDPDAYESFSLSKNFIGKAEASQIIRVFILFSALFHSCYGYMETKKKLDRFELYLRRLQ